MRKIGKKRRRQKLIKRIIQGTIALLIILFLLFAFRNAGVNTVRSFSENAPHTTALYASGRDIAFIAETLTRSYYLKQLFRENETVHHLHRMHALFTETRDTPVLFTTLLAYAKGREAALLITHAKRTLEESTWYVIVDIGFVPALALSLAGTPAEEVRVGTETYRKKTHTHKKTRVEEWTAQRTYLHIAYYEGRAIITKEYADMTAFLDFMEEKESTLANRPFVKNLSYNKHALFQAYINRVRCTNLLPYYQTKTNESGSTNEGMPAHERASTVSPPPAPVANRLFDDLLSAEELFAHVEITKKTLTLHAYVKRVNASSPVAPVTMKALSLCPASSLFACSLSVISEETYFDRVTRYLEKQTYIGGVETVLRVLRDIDREYRLRSLFPEMRDEVAVCALSTPSGATPVLAVRVADKARAMPAFENIIARKSWKLAKKPFTYQGRTVYFYDFGTGEAIYCFSHEDVFFYLVDAGAAKRVIDAIANEETFGESKGHIRKMLREPHTFLFQGTKQSTYPFFARHGFHLQEEKRPDACAITVEQTKTMDVVTLRLIDDFRLE